MYNEDKEALSGWPQGYPWEDGAPAPTPKRGHPSVGDVVVAVLVALGILVAILAILL